ncbi:MAG: HEAT repeat domain-containing protein [Candidatus Hodarchaeota archaeon]
MSKDLKDLINTVEKKTRSQAELEKTISSLKEEINRLKYTIKEQKLLIESLKNEKIEGIELPSEIDILKDIITSQRHELNEKQSDIEKLNNKIDKLMAMMENDGDTSQLDKDDKELLEAQMQIVQLSDENQEYRTQIKSLQNQIEELRLEKGEVEELYEEQDEEPEVNEELINLKRLNFHLMEENGLLRVELESLKAKFQERLEQVKSEELDNVNERNNILLSKLESLKAKLVELNETSSNELEIANDKINILTSELEDHDAQIKNLELQLKETNEALMISTEEALKFAKLRDKYDKLKIEMLKHKEENHKLNKIIEQLKEKRETIKGELLEEPKILESIPKQLQLSLFNRMFHLFDKAKKEMVINLLIQDLKSTDIEIKRNAIKILSHIRHEKVYEALSELSNDKDWIVRYNIIKALSKFKKKSEKFVSLLKNLSKDVDVDVRELAIKILNDISEAKFH